MSRRYNIPKEKAQLFHTIRRARERLGQRWTETDVRICVNKIRAHEKEKWAAYRGDSVFLRAQSNRVTLHAVRHNDVWFPVAYDSKRKMIASVLPVECLIFDDNGLPIDFRHQWENPAEDLPDEFAAAKRALVGRHPDTVPRGDPQMLRNRVMEA